MFKVFNLLDEPRTSTIFDYLFIDEVLGNNLIQNKTTNDLIPNHKINYDTIETNNNYIIELAIPGFEKDNVDIDLNNKKLVVSGERKLNEDTGFIKRTTVYGKFKKEFILPDNTDDDVYAEFNDGILKISIKKVVKNKKIRIK